MTTLPPPSLEAKPDLRCLLERRNLILEEQSILSRHTPMYSPGPGPLFQRRPHANTPAPLEPEIQSGCRSTSLTSRISPSFHGQPTLPTADAPHAKPPALMTASGPLDLQPTPLPDRVFGEADSLANGSLVLPGCRPRGQISDNPTACRLRLLVVPGSMIPATETAAWERQLPIT